MVARPTRKRMYRTMQGRMVDIEKLRAANETVRAVGNMSVNARGDVLGPGGEVVTKKETVMKKYYEQPRGRVDDTPARPTQVRKPEPAPQKPQVQKMSPTPKVEVKKAPEPVVAPKVVETPKPVESFKPKTESTSKKGIDAALDGLE